MIYHLTLTHILPPPAKDGEYENTVICFNTLQECVDKIIEDQPLNYIVEQVSTAIVLEG